MGKAAKTGIAQKTGFQLMNGMLNIVMVIATVIVAVVTYQAKFRARALELEIHVLNQTNRSIRNDLTVLRAEQAYLSRPERIERLARKFLTLTPNEAGRNLTGASLLSGREDMESRRSAMQVLEKMRSRDKARVLEARTEAQKMGIATVLVRPLIARKAVPQQRAVSAAQVMGVTHYSRDRAGDAQSPPKEPLEKLRSRPEVPKPKWTYHGGIGDDD